jgi:hypothetical protein
MPSFSAARRLGVAAMWTAVAIAAAWPASAQQGEWKYDKLNDLLQRKFSEPQSGAAQPQPGVGNTLPPPVENEAQNPPRTRGLQLIEPEERAQKYHQLQKENAPARASGASLQGAAAASAAARDARTRTRSIVRPSETPAAPPPAPPAPQPVAEPVPVAKPNSYVIQLKPETTGRQIDTLLSKYKLRIVSDELIKIGGLIVEQDAVPEERTKARSFNRIEDILEPKIIRDLRKEQVVKEAFVNTVVAPKWLRKAAFPQVANGSATSQWRWGKIDPTDGNWGLKYLRMPTVWSIVRSYRAKNPDKPIPVVGVVDVGFGKHNDLDFKPMLDTTLAEPLASGSACAIGHGTHVAGIIGSKFNDFGIEGAAPGVGIEVVGVKADFALEGPEVGANSVDSVLMLYTDVQSTVTRYILHKQDGPSQLRVINLSLAYNWYNVLGKKNPADNRAVERLIASQAAMFKTLAELVQDRILFVVAAGNDSRGLDVPLEAKWASSIAWAGAHQTATSKPSPNILVVEAFDHDGKRADFSNRSGHVSAPGVDVMSTAVSATGQDFALCTGTSQAAPHVAAIAAMLFEIAPDKKPREIAEAIKKTARAVPGQRYGAGQIDPLNAALELAPDSLRLLADLNADGEVNKQDLAFFKQRMEFFRLVGMPAGSAQAALPGASSGSADADDDGLPDSGKVWWPRADLNGSGLASMDEGDEQPVCNAPRSDLDIFRLAWQDSGQTFEQAMAELGLTNPSSALIATAPIAGGTRAVRSVADNRRGCGAR